jgi:hypothetical protein
MRFFITSDLKKLLLTQKDFIAAAAHYVMRFSFSFYFSFFYCATKFACFLPKTFQSAHTFIFSQPKTYLRKNYFEIYFSDILKMQKSEIFQTI